MRMSSRRSRTISPICVERGGDLGVAVVGEAALHRGEDARFVGQAHADDEGEAEFFAIGGVERVEAVELGLGEPVEPGAGLLGGAGLGEAAVDRGLAGELGMGADQGELLLGRRRRGRRPSGRHAGRRTTGRASARASTQGECSNRALIARPARSAAAG